MKIIVIGATGTIGQAVADALEDAGGHEVIRASRSGAVSVNIEDPDSIRRMYTELGPLDAVVSTAGAARFGPLAGLSDEDFDIGLRSKLMGQINLVRLGLAGGVREGGSITLTSGILSRMPNPMSAAVTTVNAGLEGFVRAAAMAADNLRINIVSPPLVRETAVKLGWGTGGMPAAQVARAYAAAVTGDMRGQVIEPS